MTTNDSPAPRPTLPSPDGLRLQPFRALRYAERDPARLGRRLSPPYDVISDAQRIDLERADPHNAVHLILPRPELGSPTSASATRTEPGAHYTAAATRLRQWQEAGVLVRDDTVAVYVYEIGGDSGVTRGLIGALALAQPEAGIVLPHEDTMPGPVADRLALTEATEANLEPIFCVYDGTEGTAKVLESVDARPPIAQAITAEDTLHRLWALTDPAELDMLAQELQPLHALIADGHHRYATYLQHQRDQHDKGAGPGPWDYGLAFLVDARRFGPSVEAIHRVIPDLPLQQAISAAAAGFEVTGIDGPVDSALAGLADTARPSFVVTDGAQWTLLTRPDPGRLAAVTAGEHSSAWRDLDVTVAHRFLFSDLWGLTDTATTVDFQHDPQEAIRQARQRHGVAVLLNPTPVDQVAQVAADGERMPRKSTLFLPKPRTGMLFRPFASE